MTTHKSNQHGFAMAEVMVALIVLSLMAGALHISMIERQVDLIKHDLFDQVAGEVHLMAQAAQQYAQDKTTWPDEDADCATAHAEMTSSGWLRGVALQSPLYDASGNATDYTFNCADEHFEITVVAENAGQALDLRHRLPGSVAADATLTASYPKIAATQQPEKQGTKETPPKSSAPCPFGTLPFDHPRYVPEGKIACLLYTGTHPH